jgi:hypothetical protein
MVRWKIGGQREGLMVGRWMMDLVVEREMGVIFSIVSWATRDTLLVTNRVESMNHIS